MTLDIRITSGFKKDLKKIRKQNKNLEELYTVIETLARRQKLADKYKDHQLTGNWKGRRECHIRPDWLYLERTGSHSELLSK